MLNRELCHVNFNEQSFDIFDNNKIHTELSIFVPTHYLTSTVANTQLIQWNQVRQQWKQAID